MRRLRFITFTVLLGSAAGCTGIKDPPCLAVKGKVTLKASGEPCKGAFVVFHPATPELEKLTHKRRPFATVGDDGAFELTSFQEKDGAPEGEYNVTIVWETKGKETDLKIGDNGGGLAPKPDRLQGRYGDPLKPRLTAKVAKGGDNTFNFTLDDDAAVPDRQRK